jgi:hypothetical protein
LIGAVVGALIGVSATLASEHMRWRRGRQDSDKATKRQTYADYLAALSLTRNELRLAARRSSLPLGQRSKRAAEAFRTGGAFELRYQVALIAPTEVITASDQAFRTLRLLRDLVEDGTLHTDAAYIGQRDVWEGTFAALKDHMRYDLEAS